MKFSLPAVLTLSVLALVIYSSCSKDPDEPAPNPCAGVTISVTGTVTSTAPNQSTGSISVSATGGTGFTYSVNNGAFSPVTSYTNLAAGTYTVTAKNSNGCTGSAQFVVTTANPCTGVTVTAYRAIGLKNGFYLEEHWTSRLVTYGDRR